MAIKKKKIIEVISLTKKFGNKIANDNITFDIYEGERIGIIGANGAGKTTLVEQIIGITKPTAGTVKYNFPYHSTPQEQMGMQFQDSSYPEGLTVKDVIDFTLDIYGAKIGTEKLNELLKRFQVQTFYKTKAKGLSGGQQQKLNVLLAVVHNPKIVILDEISTGLDISAREEIVGYVDELTKQNKTTTILVSHHMSEIERLCTRVVILKAGKILEIDSIKAIKDKYKSLDIYMRDVIMKENKYEKSK